MSSTPTIIIAYAAGTQEMLDICLTALEKHDNCADYGLIVGTDDSDAAKEAQPICDEHGFDCSYYDVGIAPTGSGRHARILDAAMNDVKTDRVITLDSDCIPVADGWMDELSDMLDDGDSGAATAGILYPWVPPPADLDPATMEYKIRKFHNWNYTHVACQMVRVDFLKKYGLGFSGLYDTGLRIPTKAHELGFPVVGWKPTRCAKPEGDFDAEFNRLVCVVFGDKMYHHGGASRQATGEEVCWGEFDKARARVFAEKSADWILQPENCYHYRLDREEDVAQFKMKMHYEAMVDYLKTHKSVFGENWW